MKDIVQMNQCRPPEVDKPGPNRQCVGCSYGDECSADSNCESLVWSEYIRFVASDIVFNHSEELCCDQKLMYANGVATCASDQKEKMVASRVF